MRSSHPELSVTGPATRPNPCETPRSRLHFAHGRRKHSRHLHVVSAGNGTHDLGKRSYLQSRRQNVCAHRPRTCAGMAFLQGQRGKLLSTYRTRRNHSCAVPGARAMDRPGNERRVAARRTLAPVAGILRSGGSKASEENARRSFERFPSDFREKEILAASPEEIAAENSSQKIISAARRQRFLRSACAVRFRYHSSQHFAHNWRGCDILLLRSQRADFACEAD